MPDRSVSLYNVLAWFCWGLAATFVVIDLLLPSNDVGHVGFVFAAAGGTLHIRCMFCCLRRGIDNAFEVGRDAGRLESVPTQRFQ